ncbi:hypothetical protein H4219_006306 [Mycoemilia scoparia]|uniref:Uncharacterized protein n=1 Tax=Mycoemilia scoparia TaxID=417184 RepID=A0A9W7ZJX6_9FUNG|nr:hypothetical protein H4219_006306 [Mycoemilia scoparia]
MSVYSPFLGNVLEELSGHPHAKLIRQGDSFALINCLVSHNFKACTCDNCGILRHRESETSYVDCVRIADSDLWVCTETQQGKANTAATTTTTSVTATTATPTSDIDKQIAKLKLELEIMNQEKSNRSWDGCHYCLHN